MTAAESSIDPVLKTSQSGQCTANGHLLFNSSLSVLAKFQIAAGQRATGERPTDSWREDN